MKGRLRTLKALTSWARAPLENEDAKEGSQGIRPIGRIMMRYGKRVENYTVPKRPRTFVQRGEQRTWHSGRERERPPSLSRRIVHRAKLQNFSGDILYVWHLPIRRDGKPILPRCTLLACESCASKHGALRSKKWTIFQTRIIISHRVTREKIYPVCFLRTPSVVSVIGGIVGVISINHRVAHLPTERFIFLIEIYWKSTMSGKINFIWFED